MLEQLQKQWIPVAVSFLSSNFFLYNQKYIIKPKIKSSRREYPRNSPSRSFMPDFYKDLCRWIALIKGKILLEWMKQLWCVMVNLWSWSWFLLYAEDPLHSVVWDLHCNRSLKSMAKSSSSVSFAQNIFEILSLVSERRSCWFCQILLEDNTLHIGCHFENCVVLSVKRQLLQYFVP